ncbi:MAG: tetraacyldisaccharide 4'-kinase [Alphaproteobacteria bacterium]|nr:tetraacyldisaccharide 4'-kinase [Alphaproteobacteria bacterium]
MGTASATTPGFVRAPEFWQRSDSAVARLLAPAGMAWLAAAKLRRAMARPYRAPVPVVCIGNLVAGGAGKTPVALAAARWYGARGLMVHLLSRGYGGRVVGPHRVDPALDTAADVGDEPLLLAARAPTWVAHDRAAGARAAAQAGAGLIVMDDGFQNPSLVKTLSLLVVDGGQGFGNGRVIPAGPLRERVDDGLARADAVVLVGEDRVGALDALGSRVPVMRARLVPGADGARYRGERVAAFAGIGRPQKFYQTLRDLGALVVATRDFADHHRYEPEEVMAMVEHAAKRDAVLVTTAKDAVRLPPGALNMVHVLPVELAWDDEHGAGAILGRALDGSADGRA